MEKNRRFYGTIQLLGWDFVGKYLVNWFYKRGSLYDAINHQVLWQKQSNQSGGRIPDHISGSLFVYSFFPTIEIAGRCEFFISRIYSYGLWQLLST